MDRYDPNEWTRSFVIENQSFCLEFLRDTNTQVANLLREGEYKAAVAGLDRILNGLITMQNAGGDYRSHISLFSWIEADVILFGIEDAPDDRKRDTAIGMLADARDFSKSDTNKQKLSAMISDVRGGRSISSLKSEYSPTFPEEEIDTLQNLNGKLVPSYQSTSSSSGSTTSGSSSSGCGGCFIAAIVIAIIVGIIAFVLMFVPNVMIRDSIAPTPTPIESTIQE